MASVTSINSQVFTPFTKGLALHSSSNDNNVNDITMSSDGSNRTAHTPSTPFDPATYDNLNLFSPSVMMSTPGLATFDAMGSMHSGDNMHSMNSAGHNEGFGQPTMNGLSNSYEDFAFTGFTPNQTLNMSNSFANFANVSNNTPLNNALNNANNITNKRPKEVPSIVSEIPLENTTAHITAQITATLPQAAALAAAADTNEDGSNQLKWTKDADKKLRFLVGTHGESNWPLVAKLLNAAATNATAASAAAAVASSSSPPPPRTPLHCMNRWYKVLKPGMRKGPWTKDEDNLLLSIVSSHPSSDKVKWSTVATLLPGRIGKQCRERYFNHLDPSVKKGKWSEEEDTVIFSAQLKMGNQWCEIAKLLPGRTENAVKNRFNSSARKKWQNSQHQGQLLANAVMATNNFTTMLQSTTTDNSDDSIHAVSHKSACTLLEEEQPLPAVPTVPAAPAAPAAPTAPTAPTAPAAPAAPVPAAPTAPVPTAPIPTAPVPTAPVLAAVPPPAPATTPPPHPTPESACARQILDHQTTLNPDVNLAVENAVTDAIGEPLRIGCGSGIPATVKVGSAAAFATLAKRQLPTITQTEDDDAQSSSDDQEVAAINFKRRKTSLSSAAAISLSSSMSSSASTSTVTFAQDVVQVPPFPPQNLPSFDAMQQTGGDPLSRAVAFATQAAQANTDKTPMFLLPYYSSLSEEAQRSLIKQLVDAQTAAVSTRSSAVPTPTLFDRNLSHTPIQTVGNSPMRLFGAASPGGEVFNDVDLVDLFSDEGDAIAESKLEKARVSILSKLSAKRN